MTIAYAGVNNLSKTLERSYIGPKGKNLQSVISHNSENILRTISSFTTFLFVQVVRYFIRLTCRVWRQI